MSISDLIIEDKETVNDIVNVLQQINDCKYKIDKIYFIPSDSFSEVVYKELTIEIIKRLEQSDKFNS